MGGVKTLGSGIISRLIWPAVRAAGDKTTWSDRWEESGPVEPIDIWIHTASVGEVTPLFRLIEQSDLRFGVTVTSGRSFDAVQEKFGDVAQVKPFPIPRSPNFEALVEGWQPRRLVLLEAEAWPVLLGLVPETISSLAVLGGRIRFPNHMQWRSLFSRIDPEQVQSICVETTAQAAAFRKAGCPDELISTGFFSKLLSPPEKCSAELRDLRNTDDLTVVAGSIHPNEIQIVGSAWRDVLKMRPKARLIVVPRHPDNANAMIAELHSMELAASPWPEVSSITFVNQFGVLAGLYEIADVALVGGAWNSKGGHTPVEALVHAVPTIIGPNHHNQDSLMKVIDDAVIVANDSKLAERILHHGGTNAQAIAPDLTQFQRTLGMALRALQISDT